jgi:tRNA acetyltransferase TAN1
MEGEMVRNFNLMATTQRGNERNCVREVLMLIDEVGGPETKLWRTRFPGLLVGVVKGDPVELLRRMRPLIEKDPWDLRFTQRLVPIQRNVAADIPSIREAAGELAPMIPNDASFRIVVNKRGSDLRTMEVIREAASKIDRRVDLENPDKVIHIEIIDDVAGISLIDVDDIVSVTKLQEKAMEG